MPKIKKENNQFILYFHSLITRLIQSEQSQLSNIVQWDPKGKGFIVNNQQKFTTQILLNKLAISRFDSFVRKLNKFGFRRSKNENSKFRFFHKDFSKDGRSLHKIRKLSKQEFLPKHIKLRIMRQKLNEKNHLQNQNSSESNKGNKNNIQEIQNNQQKQLQNYNNQQFYEQTSLKQSKVKKQIVEESLKQDIGIYLLKDKQIALYNTKNYRNYLP